VELKYRYQLIGDAYVHGIMYGELAGGWRKGFKDISAGILLFCVLAVPFNPYISL
jgi:hypothetical protein